MNSRMSLFNLQEAKPCQDNGNEKDSPGAHAIERNRLGLLKLRNSSGENEFASILTPDNNVDVGEQCIIAVSSIKIL